MDKDEARFILHSFRPDGADAADPDFAAALKLAMENRELGEWLANERAFDASFAEALGTVELPQELRDDIFACLAAERGDYPQAQDPQDAAWIGALASVQPPPGFRDELITAMNRTVAVEKTKKGPNLFRRFAIPVAAAAGVALAFLVTRPGSASGTFKAVPFEAVQAGFVKTYDSPAFALEEKRENFEVLVRHLQQKKLPCPGGLPPGLKDKKGIGCRELEIDGKKGSLICFKVGEQGVVHIMVFRRNDVSGDFPPKESPEFAQYGNWVSARWQDGSKVFVVMSDSMGEKLTELF